MTEETSLPIEAPRRFQFQWVPAAFLRPRSTFGKIAALNRSVWATPMLILTVTTLGRVMAAGWLRQQAALNGEVQLPMDFQYYPPEMQAQFLQAQQATQSPVFHYVFPAITALMGIWLGWLLVSGLIHLVLTMLGGRGDTSTTINLVAWASLPFALRDLVRTGAMLATRELINSPGLAGFAPAGSGSGSAYLVALLALIDLYVIWHILLIATGVKSGNGLTTVKALGGVTLSIVAILGIQALLSWGISQISGMTVVRPFF